MGALEACQMERVEIEFPQTHLEALTQALVAEGKFQIEDLSSLNMRSQNSLDAAVLERSGKFASLETEIGTAMAKLQVKPKKLGDQKIDTVTDPAEIEAEIKPLHEQIDKLEAQIKTIQSQITAQNNLINITRPFRDLDFDFSSIRNRRYIYSILGMMPADKVKRFEESLAKIPHTLLTLHSDSDSATVLLIGPRTQRDFLLHAARSAYLSSLDLPDAVTGTPHEIFTKAGEALDDLEKQKESASAQIGKLKQSQAETLNRNYWRVRASRMLYEIIGRYGKLKNDYLVVGWIPSNQQDKFVRQLSSIGKDVIVNVIPDKDLDEDTKPPVELSHPRQLLGFQKLVTTYSTPDYKELDPTVIIAFTFPLIFGAMFGDLGQGLILAIFGVLLYSRKLKRFGRLSALGPVVTLSGLSAAFFGWLYGSFFGFEDLIDPLWMHPINNIMLILLTTFAGGALILTLANILAIANDVHNKNWAHALFSGKGLAGLLLYWSLLAIVVESFTGKKYIPVIDLEVVSVISVVAIMASGFLERLFAHRKPLFEGGFFLFFITSFFELFETLLGFLSNSLSFVRVGAFAVAHAGLSSVFLMLAEMVSPDRGLAFWLVIVFGNIFIIGFEGMIVSIQTLRLEYYEFFSKFFKGGGVKYRPLEIIENSRQGA